MSQLSKEPGHRYVIISPVRDEEPYIEFTLRSMISQTRKPALWVIVNDGSTDDTGVILDRYSSERNWIKVVHRLNRGYRAAGGGVIEAFYEGFSIIGDLHWDFIVKLDGDLSFDPEYFESCLACFEKEPNLGIAGGTVCIFEKGGLKVDSEGDPPFHVRGATKIYRRGCWEKVSPLVQAPGWDTIDEVKANYYGWKTRTFQELKLIQHKRTGGADGHLRNWFKNGRANYVTGYHPLFMVAKCLKRAYRMPLLVESAALWLGFCSGYLKGVQQLQDKDTIRYLRRQQMLRLKTRPSIYG